MRLEQGLSLIGLLACFAGVASALRCYSCNGVSDNSNCRRSVRCPPGSNGCENVVRMENGILRITKRCQQFQACTESSKQNYLQCSPSVQTILSEENLKASRTLPPSVCRSCCKGDLCNKQMFLKEISRVGLKNPGSSGSKKIKLVPSQPSIRNVRVRLLTSSAALITFKDADNHSASFFSVKLQPSRGIRVAPIRINKNTIPGIKLNIPKGTIPFLARGLSSGTQYRIRVVSTKDKRSKYSQRILKSFVTRPRRPRRLKLKSATTNSVKFFVVMRKNKGHVSYYSFSYRKVGDPPRRARKLPNVNSLRLQTIRGLKPSTAYVISAWTNIAGAQGRLLGSSSKVNLTVYTAVPAVKDIVVRSVHATNITWGFRLPYYARRRTQDQFVITVRDSSTGMIVADTAIRGNQRRFTAKELTPRTPYTFSIRARWRKRNSAVKRSDPVYTLLRCYSCYDAITRDECDQYIECPAHSGGCLNEVRRRSFTNTNTREPEWYRATLKCKQVTACNNSESQDHTAQCKPSTNRNTDPPDVCRCCCEGDLCNGPGNTCGHILGWLDRFRSPEKPMTTLPPFCPKPVIDHGSYQCTSGESEQEIGSQCKFACDDGFYRVGEETLNCFDNGEWDESFPVCLPRKQCSAIPQFNGTTLVCTNGFTAGSECSVSCADGYLAFATESIRCELSGQWSEPIIPFCIAEDDCQPDPCFNGATCHDLPNNYECECIDGWTGRHCEIEVFCTVLFSPENGKLECTDRNRFDSRCRYTCKVGYEQHGSKYTRCSADGYWTAFEPTTCIIKTCEVPPRSLINGGVAQCSGYEYSDTCQFSCPSGLSIAGGPANITCQDDKKWSGNFPCCDLQCPPHAKVDLYFLLDSSSSVGRSNWNLLINFTLALLDQFALGPDDLVVGVGRYNRRFDRRSEISFGDYEDRKDLRRKIKKMPYRGEGTRTGQALWHLRSVSLTDAGNRKGVPNIVVVITDGKATDKVATPARFIKSFDNTKVYAVGVKNQFHQINFSQLEVIASGPKYLQVIEDGYEELAREFSKTLTEDVCSLPCQYLYEQREVLLRQRQLAISKGQKVEQKFWSGVNSNSSVAVQPGVVNQAPVAPVEREGGNQRQATLDESIPGQAGPVKKQSR